MFAENDLTIQKLEVPTTWEWKKGPQRLCFVFPQKGRGVYGVDGQAKHAFSAGDVLVLDMSVPGSIHRLGRQKLNGLFFNAYLEHLMAVFSMSEFCLFEKSAKASAAPWIFPSSEPLALKCHQLLQSAPEGPSVEHRCHLLQLVAVVFAERWKSSATSCLAYHTARNPKGRLLKSLSLEQIHDTSGEELARKYGYSRRHLNRLFNDVFGLSVSALKMEMRLLKAVALLRDPAIKILSVARECGFNHVNLFSSRFRKRFGASPSEWRNHVLPSEPKDLAPNGHEICPVHGDGLCPLPGVPGLTPTRMTSLNQDRRVARELLNP